MKKSMKSLCGVGLAAITAFGMMGVPGVVAAPAVELPWPGAVSGGPEDLTDSYAQRTTADGWTLHVEKTEESVNFAPALDGGITTGESFGTLTGKTWIDGDGIEPLTGAYFETGYQIGCGIDISNGADIELAGVLGSSPSIGVNPTAEAGVDAGVQGTPQAMVTADAGARAGVGVAGEAAVDSRVEVAPTAAFALKPGGITNITLAGYPVNLEKGRAAGGFTGAHLQINGCGGPVSIRSFVSLSTVSETSVDSVAVYGPARRIR